MKRKIKIAVIDSGFDFYHPLVNRIADYKCFCKGFYKDDCGHGTSVVRVIDGKCRDCEFYILKVLDSQVNSDFQCLQAALRYAINKNVDIINASLGVESAQYQKEIDEICIAAYQKNIILANTQSNGGNRNYLFEHNKVLKVVGGKNIREDKLYYKDNVYYVLGMARMIPWLEGHYIIKGGNSFSLPLIIPYVVKALRSGCKGLENVHFFLQKMALQIDDVRAFYEYPVVEKENPIDTSVYNNVRDYLKSHDLIVKGNVISDNVYVLYRIEEILQDLQKIFQCSLPCETFQYPDWCYVENLSNKINQILCERR